jgi:hypothetical protein
MIYKSSSPLSPAVTVVIDGVPVDYSSIVGAELMLEENKHDLLIIKLLGVPPQVLHEYLTAPVVFTIDSGTLRTQKFVGYVSNIEPVSQTNHGFVNGSPFQQVDVYCVGASFSMKVTNSKSWNPPTLNNVVSSMSKKYGFSADFPKSKYVPINITQTAESDWEFLVKTVNKYSFKVTVHGTHIHVWDTYSATGRSSSYHELFTPDSQMGPHPCTIMNFDGFFGSLSPTGYSSSTTVAYLDRQGSSFQVNTRTLRDRSGLGRAVKPGVENFVSSSTQSFEEAQKELLRIRKNNMPFNAKVQVSAGAGIVPGGVVNVLNYGSEFDGLWYVKSVKHVLQQNHYTTDLELTKDALYTKNNEIKPVTKFRIPSDSIVVDKKWVARTRKVTEYA